jgi:tRNA A37 threonylcarbamoyladenosine synthetase subunit TsaC/SUA5/YrdC
VLHRSPAAAGLALGGDPTTIGVRCPAHPVVRAIAARVGPLAVTSANRHGHPTPPSAREAADGLAVPPDLVIDGGPAGSVASTVVDATDPERWRVLRVGAVTEADLTAALS